jgi:hypothetical protein
MRHSIVVSLRAAAWVLALAGSGSAFAQGLEPVLVVADCHVTPGKEAEFIAAANQLSPVFTKLSASGDVLSWGVSSVMFHRPGQPNFSAWYTAKDFGAVEKVEAGFEAFTAEQEKAAKAARAAGKPAGKTTFERWLATFNLATHKDWAFREQIFEVSKLAPGTKPFIWLTWLRAQPGKAIDLRAAWEKHQRPVYAKLLAEGAISGYGFTAEELKSTDDITHMTWILLPDLGAREKVRAALDARTEEEKTATRQAFLAAMDPTAARSTVLRSELFVTASR